MPASEHRQGLSRHPQGCVGASNMGRPEDSELCEDPRNGHTSLSTASCGLGSANQIDGQTRVPHHQSRTSTLAKVLHCRGPTPSLPHPLTRALKTLKSLVSLASEYVSLRKRCKCGNQHWLIQSAVSQCHALLAELDSRMVVAQRA